MAPSPAADTACHPLGAHELVHVIEALVIAQVAHRAAVTGERRLSPLVLGSAQCSALAWSEFPVEGIEFDHPAEAKALVGLLGEVEAVLGALPSPIPEFGQSLPEAVALVGGPLGRVGHIPRVHEVLVEVLLSGEVGAPGSVSAGAVVQTAQHPPPGGILLRLQPPVAGRGAGQLHRCRGGDAAIPVRLPHELIAAAPSLAYLDDRHAVRHQLDLDALEVIGRGARRVEVGEHQLAVRVLVVDHEEPTLAVTSDFAKGKEGDVVAVVAELLGLRLTGLVVEIELRRARQDRFPPLGEYLGQYTSLAFGKRLSESGIVSSMGSVGDAYDNAAAESFIATIKSELLHRYSWPTRMDAELAVFDFIEVFYNRRRRHSTNGLLSPMVFEERYWSTVRVS